MRTTFNINNKLSLVSEMTNESIFQVFEYDYLKGVNVDLSLNEISNLKDLDIKLKQVRVVIDDSSIIVKEGLLSYMRGSIETVNKQKLQIPIGNKIFKNRLPKELDDKMIFQGSGEIFLEPSFGYFTLIELENEEIIIKDDIFYACEDGIEVIPFIKKVSGVQTNSEDSSLLLKLKGEGIVALELPVPENEIIRCKIYKDKLVINGDLVVLTTNSIEHKLDKLNSFKKYYNTQIEENVNIYTGIGEVWLLPTINAYQQFNTSFNMHITDDINCLDED